MKAKEYQKVITELANKADLAIHIVDKDYHSIVYNENMAIVEKIQREDVLGKPFLEVFSHIEKEDSTLWQALSNRKSTINVEQTYQNAYGKQVTSVNSTYPVFGEDGEVIAAFEIARDITGIKDMSETLLALQSEARPAKAKTVEKPMIRRYTFDDIKGNNREFKSVINRAKRASNSSASVFIYGETGTGKELFAQSIHYASERKNGPFLAQNCAAIPESLLEGILFGTTKGGFTGAVDRAGLFEQANGGTLLLDEISAMPYDLQSKLLRVLQEEYIRRVGGSKDIPVDVRIIATVNRDPHKLIEEGRLRSDLYYRLNIINIDIPPLRERRDDILELTDEFIKKDNEKFGKEIWMLSEKAKEKLISHDYPGNVRELRNLITAAVSMADREHVLTENMLMFVEGAEPRKQIDKFRLSDDNLDDYLEMVEKSIIKEALAASDGNISKAAELLAIKRQTLQHKLRKYGM